MSFIRPFIKRWLLRRDIIISRPPGQFEIGKVKLARLRDRGFKCRLAIDGGADEGAWAANFLSTYPDAQVLCIEPRANAQPALESLAKQRPGIHIARTLVGAAEGEVEFNESGAQSSMLKNSRGDSFGQTTRHPITTLDKLIERKGLPQPDLIKLDLQGAELEALRGAPRSLEAAQAVLLEVSFIAFQEGTPLAAEVIAFMQQRGFRIYDIFALWHRPLDGALAQGDFLFMKEGHSLLADRRWSADTGWA